MPRRLSTLALSVLTLLATVALPSAAAETETPGVVGSYGGLALAALVGIVVGIVVFAVAQGGAPDEEDHAHH